MRLATPDSGVEARVDRRERKPVPPIAWVLSIAVAVAVTVLVVRTVSAQGQNGMFNSEADALFFRLVARHPFGSTHGFVAVHQLSEAPYRYGRIGLPLLGWILALGRPAWVGWSLIGVYIVSIAAIPGVAAVLLDDLGAPPAAAGFVLLAPGILLNYAHVYSDPLLITLLLLACVFEGRGRRTAALVTIAAAIMVKEVAVFALIPWIWAALARRDKAAVAKALSAALPYLVWSTWIRWRLGTFPFFAHTYSRSGALSLPFVGLGQAWAALTPNIGLVTGAVAVTVVLGVLASWAGRGSRIGALAAVYTVLTVCLGRNALAYLLENARVMAVTQVLAVLCLVVAVCGWAAHKGHEKSAGFS